MAFPHPAGILPEHDIENPVQPALDPPVAPHPPRDLGRRPGVAGEVVVRGGRSDAAYLPFPVHLHHGRDLRPVGRQSLGVADHRRVPLLLSPVGAVGRLAAVHRHPHEVPLAGVREHRLHRVVQGRLIPLHGQQVVPALLPDDRRVLDLATGRVDGHDRPAQVQGAEQLGDHPDLIRPVRDGHLTEGEPVLGGPRAHHRQAPGSGTPLGPPGRLPVDGDGHQAGALTGGGHPPAERPAKGTRFEFGEDPGERVGTGNAVGQGQEAAEEGLLRVAVLGDGVPPVGPADDRARRDGQDIGEAVELVLRLPSRVRQLVEHGRDRQGHRASSVIPHGVARNRYGVSGS